LSQETTNTERLKLFSDAVFGVIITVMVLELRPPHEHTWAALGALWPTAVSYAVSYLFVAIVWVNHHHILQYARVATPRLVWGNFGHLFTVSLVPFSTAWIADSRLASVPVFIYATVFVLVNLSYIVLCVESANVCVRDLPPRIWAMLHRRSATTLAVFALAAVIALFSPVVGFGLICCCLLVYTRPDRSLKAEVTRG